MCGAAAFFLDVGAWILADVEVVQIWAAMAAGNRQATNSQDFWAPAVAEFDILQKVA